VISLERLRALAALLSNDDGARGFAELDIGEQAIIFGLIEENLAGVLITLINDGGA
jgi:hypothetical protein